MTQVASASHGNREFAFDTKDFREIAGILHADSGIALTEQKMPLVYGRLVKRLRALGLASFRQYCTLLTQADGADERQKMTAALTTNVTRFMREPHHFEYVRTAVLPKLLEAARRGGRVRIWSAGCSSGQEPYSLAIIVLALMPNAAELDVKILATDIDPNMVAAGRNGTYGEAELVGLPQADIARHFKPCEQAGGRKWQADTTLRRLCTFREVNLIGDWPMRGQFDVIFCRNVVIYFDDPTQEMIWKRFAAKLQVGGVLCIGHSERLSGPAKPLYRQVATTAYEHVGARR